MGAIDSVEVLCYKFCQIYVPSQTAVAWPERRGHGQWNLKNLGVFDFTPAGGPRTCCPRASFFNKMSLEKSTSELPNYFKDVVRSDDDHKEDQESKADHVD
jgi:hypothetical protein